MTRIFIYDDRQYPDPDPNMTVDEVRQHMSTFFPELSNSTSTEKKDGDITYHTFSRRVGTKGKSHDNHPL